MPLVRITLARGRAVEKKEALYRRIAEGLEERAGVADRVARPHA